MTVTEWSQVGLDSEDIFGNLSESELLDCLVERATALLWIRVIALLSNRKEGRSPFPDYSTSSICRAVLVHDKAWSTYAPAVTTELLDQLKMYVRFILSGYNDTPYHCNEHAYHVLLSVNKLMDLMLHNSKAPSYGLRQDVLAHFALLFAALAHDVEHTGVPNRQLSVENDPLSILYNDQSIAEHRSLFIAFHELLKPQYKELRCCIFGREETESESYLRFRKIVIDLVLSTDIASPERTQIAKSKWKEAFGDPFETVERKLKLQLNAGTAADNDDEESLSHTPDSSVCQDEEQERFSVSFNIDYSNSIDDDQIFTSKPFSQGVTRKVSVDYNSLKDLDKSSTSIDYGITPMTVPSPQGRRGKNQPHAKSMPMVRRSSLTLLQTDEAYKAKFQRRMSTQATSDASVHHAEKFRRRLSICRSIDFSGEEIENYRRGSTASRCSTYSTYSVREEDDTDELKAAVVLETMMTAADVAHNLQGYEQMVIWSGRLFLELRKAYVQGRGGNPEYRWFENQIGFLESYLLPLARRLEDTGVFGDVGSKFTTIVEANRDAWLAEGQEVTEAIIQMGEETFNAETLADENATKRDQPAKVEKLMSLVKEAQLNISDLSSLLQMLRTIV